MDTINYRFKTVLPPWWELKKDGLKQKGKNFYKNIPRDGCTLKLQTSDYCRQQYLNVELSAPKLFYKTNVEMVTAGDLEYLNDTVTSIVNEETRIPFEANDAELTRLDLAHNWKTPSETYAHAYRDEMKSRTLSGRFQRWTGDKDHCVETVYWSNKSQEILIYPKFAETQKLAKTGKVSLHHLEQCRGMIRLEHRLLKADVIRRELDRFGYKNRAGDVVPHLLEITEVMIKNDMKQLGLDSPIEITGELERLKRLQEACGDNTEKLQSLLAFLTTCDLVGESNVVGMGLMKDGTFRNRKSELKKLGISISKPKRAYTLPPLPVPSYHDAEKQFSKTKHCSPRRILPPTIGSPVVNVEGIF